MVPSFKFVSCRRSRSLSTNLCVVVAAIVLGSLVMGGCGQQSKEPSTQLVELGGPPPIATPASTADPLQPGVRSKVEAALGESLAAPTGSVQRHTRAGIDGISVVIVTDLNWRGGSGHMSKEFMVDEKFLSDPQVRELVDSTNRELQSENRDLRGSELDDILETAHQTMSQLLDDVELTPLGLGWWEGTTGGQVDKQTLRVFIGDGRLLKISRSVDVMGSTGSDTWEFTS